MAWLDTLRAGSWRGIPFGVAPSRADSYGRRGPIVQYPERDKPYKQDLGRKARTYTIEAIVFGPDYAARRDRLITAAEEKGAGILQHPDYGFLKVNCENLSVSHSLTEGGAVKLSFSFVESGEPLFPLLSGSRFGEVAGSAAKALEKAGDTFQKYWNLEGAPSIVVSAAENLIADLATFSAGLVGPAAPSGAAAQIASIGENAAALAAAPAVFVESALNLVAIFGTGDILASPEETLTIIDWAAQYGLNDGTDETAAAAGVPVTKPIDTTTPAGQQQQTNQDALKEYFWALIAASVIDHALKLEYKSYDQAANLRGSIVDLLDAIRLVTPDSELYNDLETLRLDVFDTIPDSTKDLPRIVTETPARTIPALLLAWNKYSDAERADEISNRNSLENPLFILGGTTVKILNA